MGDYYCHSNIVLKYLLIISNPFLYLKKIKMHKTYHFNPSLTFIKKNWKGNVMIKNQFVFESVIEKIPLSAIGKYAIYNNPQKK